MLLIVGQTSTLVNIVEQKSAHLRLYFVIAQVSARNIIVNAMCDQLE